MNNDNTARGSFGSQLGVVLASAGSAVGLGNIWRFPTEVGKGGGAAFILIYLCFKLRKSGQIIGYYFGGGFKSSSKVRKELSSLLAL